MSPDAGLRLRGPEPRRCVGKPLCAAPVASSSDRLAGSCGRFTPTPAVRGPSVWWPLQRPRGRTLSHRSARMVVAAQDAAGLRRGRARAIGFVGRHEPRSSVSCVVGLLPRMPAWRGARARLSSTGALFVSLRIGRWAGLCPLARPGRGGRTWSRTFSSAAVSAASSRGLRCSTKCSWIPRWCTSRAACSVLSPVGVIRTLTTRRSSRGPRAERGRRLACRARCITAAGAGPARRWGVEWSFG